MTTTAEKIEVMQAFERGEAIEAYCGNAWKEIKEPTWNWDNWTYRIAPKPKKTVDLYQWLCNDAHNYYISNHYELAPYNRINRLDHTKMTQNKPHKHAELIKAWADGAEIEYWSNDQERWKYIGRNFAWLEDFQYRLKPTPKPDITRTMFVEVSPTLDNAYNMPNVEFVFDGETHKLKAVKLLTHG